MELRQLRYLVALADERHFTRAAAREHVAQPALSQQLRRLEDELGLSLVTRTTRRVELTEAGEALVRRARRALAEVDAARAELDDLAGVRAGRVTIGAMQSLGPFDLSALLSEFFARHPGVELIVREEVSDPLLAMLAADAVDVAFLSLAEDFDRELFEAQTLLVEPMVAVMAADHRLAARDELALGDLRDERFITFREGAGLRRILLAAAAEAGFAPQIAFESNNVLRGRALAARGLGVSVVPASDAAAPGPEVASVPLRDPPQRDVTLVWRRRRHHSPAARAFLALARDAA
jgi:LysR family transcriptional regulator, transcription activator of glutamate synthase operon